jgi:hypothetical protein
MHAQTLKRASLLQLARDGHVTAELERRWLALDDDGFFLLLGRLRRLIGQFERPAVEGQVENDNDQAIRDLCARLDALVEQLDKLAATEEDEAAGIERTKVASRIRQPQMERPPSSKPARASSRAQADVAAIPTTVEAGWRLGTVERFDQRSLTGAIVFNGDRGSVEVPISLAAFRRSGLTNLFSDQLVEALIETCGDGRSEVVEVKLSAASRRMDALRANPMAERVRAVGDRYPGW